MQTADQRSPGDRLGQEDREVHAAIRFAALAAVAGMGFLVLAALWVSTCPACCTSRRSSAYSRGENFTSSPRTVTIRTPALGSFARSLLIWTSIAFDPSGSVSSAQACSAIALRSTTAGDRRISSSRIRSSVCVSAIVPALDAHDHRRGDARELLEIADGADAGELVRLALRRGAATAAEAVVAVPLDDLHRAAGELPDLLVEGLEEPAEPLEGHPWRRLGVRRETRGPGLGGAQRAGELRLGCLLQGQAERGPFLAGGHPRGRPFLEDEELAPAEGEPEALGTAHVRAEGLPAGRLPR